MDTIVISDLEVFYCVGVPVEERANPQRLLITVEMAHNFGPAARTDDLSGTIDYDAVCKRLLALGDGRQWKLIETLAVEIAEMILRDFRPVSVTVEVKKFIIPQTRHVGVRVFRPS